MLLSLNNKTETMKSKNKTNNKTNKKQQQHTVAPIYITDGNAIRQLL